MSRKINGEPPVTISFISDSRRTIDIIIYADDNEAEIRLSRQAPDTLTPDSKGRIIGRKGSERVLIWFPQVDPAIDLNGLGLDRRTLRESAAALRDHGLKVSPQSNYRNT